MTDQAPEIDAGVMPAAGRHSACSSLSLLIIGLDNTVLNVALPSLQTHFDAPARRCSGSSTPTCSPSPALLLTMGTLGDRFGRKRALQAGLAAVRRRERARRARAHRGSAHRPARRHGRRGGAHHARDPVGDHRTSSRARSAGRRSRSGPAIAGVGIGLGPFVGGLLLEWFSWSSVFWLNVPIAGAALAAGLLPRARQPRPGSGRDSTSRGAASRSARWSHSSTRHRGPGARLDRPPGRRLLRAGGGALAAFVGGSAAEEPMLPLDFFRDPRFSVASLGDRARLFRDDGLGLRPHAVPPVRARLQPAGGRRRLLPLALGLVLGSGDSRWSALRTDPRRRRRALRRRRRARTGILWTPEMALRGRSALWFLALAVPWAARWRRRPTPSWARSRGEVRRRVGHERRHPPDRRRARSRVIGSLVTSPTPVASTTRPRRCRPTRPLPPRTPSALPSPLPSACPRGRRQPPCCGRRLQRRRRRRTAVGRRGRVRRGRARAALPAGPPPCRGATGRRAAHGRPVDPGVRALPWQLAPGDQTAGRGHVSTGRAWGLDHAPRRGRLRPGRHRPRGAPRAR